MSSNSTIALGILVGMMIIENTAYGSVKINKIAVKDSIIPTCNLFVTAPSAVSGQVLVLEGNSGSSGADPFSGIKDLSGVTPYFSVLSQQGYIEYSSDKELGVKSVSLLWGTVDPSNSITFLDSSGNKLGKIYGSDLIAAKIVHIPQAENHYFTFSTPFIFYSIVLSAEGAGDFEHSDLKFSGPVTNCS
jgi:hypothetical protein